MFALVVAATLAGAVIDDGELIDAAGKVPHGSAASGGGVELVVDPSGKVRSCREIAGVGGTEVAEAMCRRLDSARLKPAVGPDGAKAFGLVRVFAQRQPSDSPHEIWRTGVRPELEVSLAAAPAGLPADGIITASVAVAADGAVAACEPVRGSDRALGQAACNALQTLDFEPVRNAEGTPVAFVSNVAVRFIAGA